MPQEDVIEPPRSEWIRPVMFVPKKGGQLRSRDEYRKLTAMTLRYTYLLLRMDHYSDLLGDASIFFTIDSHMRY